VKTLSELLEKSFQASPQFKRAKNRGDLMLRKDEIFEQCQRGWSLRTIWKALTDAGELTCAYSTFLNHVRRLQQDSGKNPAPPRAAAITPKKEKNFAWNPTPNKEELI
jgi:uncharacterized protein DUF5338